MIKVALEINVIQIITIIIQILTLCIILALFNIYRESYKEIKIGYTIGLLLFSLMLILKILSQIIISIFMILSNNPDISLISHEKELLPSLIELIAISVLFYITKKY